MDDLLKALGKSVRETNTIVKLEENSHLIEIKLFPKIQLKSKMKMKLTSDEVEDEEERHEFRRMERRRRRNSHAWWKEDKDEKK